MPIKPVICTTASVTVPECLDCVVDCETFSQYQRDQAEIIEEIETTLGGKLDANEDAIIAALGYTKTDIALTDTDDITDTWTILAKKK